ncbi:BgMFREP27.1 [Biomphalaria glabrata]|nr:fibrinogen-related protein I3; partial [Biomphalaria glabrata]
MALFLHLILCGSLVLLSTSELIIDVAPRVISELTAQLVINCSITNNQVQQLDLIKSLTLSRYNETIKEFEDLFVLNSSTLNLNQLVQSQHLQLSFGSLFITLTLLNPTQLDAKVYRCTVTGDNANVANVSLFAYKEVEYERNSTALIEEIRRLKKDENVCQCCLKKDDRSDSSPSSKIQFSGSSEIITEQIEPLTLKCLFKVPNQDPKEISTLQSLFILHETNGVIAYVNKGQPVVIITRGVPSKNVKGKIYVNEPEDSYLQVTWSNLKFSDSGKYFCEAHVKYSGGRTDKLTEMLTITVKSPTIDELVKVLQKVVTQIEEDKDRIQENQQNIKSMKKDLDRNVLGIKRDIDSTKQNIENFSSDVDSTLKIMKESVDTNTQNISKVQENLKTMVANISTALIEVKNQVNEVEKFHQKNFKPPTSCSNLEMYSLEEREIVTLASGLKVMCDTKTDGGGWIIFQRRINGKVDFYRDWKEYRDGFGDYSIGEFYLGNENIFKLTSAGQYDLRIDLEYGNTRYFAQYENFKVLNEAEKYKLQIGDYSGNATDSFRSHNGMFFTTFDRDNDIQVRDNCAVFCHGGWWYNDCHKTNLNGKWGRLSLEGMVWHGITGLFKSVAFSEMKIRERK